MSTGDDMIIQGTEGDDMKWPDVTDSKKRILLMALEKSLGIVSVACKKANLSRDTHYRWLKEDPKFKAAVMLINELALDFAEGKLFELMQGVTVQQQQGNQQVIYTLAPNVAANIFYLKTKGKHRGYVEKLQLEDLNKDDEVETSLDV
jgi:hypothetical protein